MLKHHYSKPSFKHFMFPILIFILLILSGCLDSSSNLKETQTQAPEKETYVQIVKGLSAKEPIGKVLTVEIMKVIDGDTIQVKLDNGSIESIRLLLVDTPETVHPSKPVQPYGKEASSFMKETLPPNTSVTIELGISERDKYGRLLAYMYKENEMINAILLQKGLARVAYIYPPNTKYIDELQKLQSDAQKKGIGIWSIESYATESGFKSKHFSGNTSKDTEKGISSKCSNPTIKGNITSRGKIYHIPSGQYYKITKPERWFCTEGEAIEAGFRKSNS
ncbi:thermonuclease family protein [Peribacillus acanthi]|uniref:thermonuclease family protein n=1 Tax=Peribacillus acanthi TaxID=2171554 RepID=UPI001F0B98E3|nr:thermonuclease family protein [Peribacillus acanthi]